MLNQRSGRERRKIAEGSLCDGCRDHDERDTVISDILPIAAEAKYPIAVLEEDGSLVGIVSKASVLSSLM